MVSLMLALARFRSTMQLAWRDPSFRLVAGLTGSMLLVGTLVFHALEGWSYLDSFYFSAITLATVGYGDFSPHTSAGKLFTVLYVFSGVGLLVAMLSLFADALLRSEQEGQGRLHRRLKQMRGKETPGETDAPTQPPAPDPAPTSPPQEEQKP
jgi:hypothetical protein